MNGGMMQMDASWGEMPPHWAVYFSVADCAATAETVKRLGGTVVQPPFQAGDVGTVAVVQDPQGAAFMVIQMDAPDTTMP
jgi:predicted enzyme related to lactoylglutathione lyase